MQIRMKSLLILTLLLPAALTAQTSPFAGEAAGREIKALSAEQITQYQNGQGMSLGLPAELNGYPGPKHVLELSEKLALTADQRKRVERIHGVMQREAMNLGSQIVDLERQLDQAFAKARATQDELSNLTVAIGERNGRLRFVHLRSHIETRKVLTPQQLGQYAQLRGYAAHQGH